MEKYLRPTPTIDCDSESIKEKARSLTEDQKEVIEKAKSLFYFVRDKIKYDVYVSSFVPEDFRASATLARGGGFCIHKAVLLAALARAVGIPARLRFAVIRNALAPDEIREIMGGNLFAAHSYDELYIEGKWVKAVSAFDREMCEKHRLILVEFDGINHALLPSHNQDGEPHIDYVMDRGCYDDLPFDEITSWRIQAYGSGHLERLRQAIEVRKAQA
ncbi:transglutaminase family protein [Chloroflexota bacterium]